MNIREFISNLSSKMELHSDNDLNDDAGSLLEMLFGLSIVIHRRVGSDVNRNLSIKEALGQMLQASKILFLVI